MIESVPRRRFGSRSKIVTGFTLVELLVVIGIIAVLIAILMPALTRARMAANLVKCQSNFRQVYAALATYVNDNKGVLPRSSDVPPGPSGTYAQIFGGDRRFSPTDRQDYRPASR